MFDFEEPEDGAQQRYIDRPALWPEKRFGKARHYFWWLVHNLIAHPLIGLIPMVKWTFDFHDWTSHRMHNQLPRF